MTTTAPTRRRGGWLELAEELAELRARAVELHSLGQAMANHGPVSTDYARTRLATRQRAALNETAETLIEWETLARREHMATTPRKATRR